MSILTNLFSGGAADLVKSVGGVVDNLTTSKEEKLQLKNDLEKIIINANKVQQEAVTSRWEADMKSGSWLSKNVRPLTLIFLTFIFVVLSFFDGNVGGFAVSKEYIPVYQTLLMVVYGAYFAGRSIEKVKKSDNK